MQIIKQEIKKKAIELGFSLVGFIDILKLESIDFPLDRELRKPLSIMPDARTVIVLGFIAWDEGLNTAVLASTGEHFHLYRESLEMLGWRLAYWLREEKGIRSLPTHLVHLKAAAQLAGLGYIGRSSLLINPEFGPYVRLVVLLCEREFEADKSFDRNLCEEQPMCKDNPLCIKACPVNAILPGFSKQYYPNEKVQQDKCTINHVTDQKPDPVIEKNIKRISQLGYIECTKCANICPYGKKVREILIPQKQGKTH